MIGLALIAVLGAFSVDRVEPPMAVLVDDAGRQHDVPLDALPAGVRPGDRLAGLTGPIVGDRAARRAALQARLARLATLETPSVVGHGGPMSKRRRPDHFTRRAKQAGYAARSVFKLEEIDRRVQLLRGGMRVLDLGCAPGSWTRYAARRVGPKGRVVGIDRRAIDFTAANVTTLVGDIYETDAEVFFEAAGGPFDVVVSDMAPDTTGNRFTDHVRSIDLCRRALHLADTLVRPGGAFVCKVFEGGDLPDLVTEVKARYRRFKRIKPKSTRSESVELFLVAQDRRPPPEEDAP